MEGRKMTFLSNDPVYYTDEKPVIGSFLCPNISKQSYGCFKISNSFNEVFGKEISQNVVVKCLNIGWKAKYCAATATLTNLSRFVRYYEIKSYNVIQFDYYGNDLFIVKIFGDTGVEKNYSKVDPEVFFTNENWKSLKKELYIVDNYQSIEYLKSKALWSFNAYENCYIPFMIKINRFNIDSSIGTLDLNEDLEGLYIGWNDGTKLVLSISTKSWEIMVRWMNGSCFLEEGWKEFTLDTEMKEGDTLVLFQPTGAEQHQFSACIFEKSDTEAADGDVSEKLSRSFLKLLSASALDAGVLVVPKQIKDEYNNNMIRKRNVEVDGERWGIVYNYVAGYVTNLDVLMKRFKLRTNETITFTLDKSNVLVGRIYQEDGIEINYESRRLVTSGIAPRMCIWDIVESSSTAVAEHSNMNLVYNQMELEDRVFPSFIATCRPDTLTKGTMILPDKIIEAYGDDIPPTVGFQFPNGRELHVGFSRSESCFTQMDGIVKEMRKFSGSILVCYYKAPGKFAVHVLDENATEIQYTELRSAVQNTTILQDNKTGVGLKFLCHVIGNSYETGRLVVPSSFHARFGNLIPAQISFVLNNGEVFLGEYAENEGTMNGILQIIERGNIERKDTVLFTNVGAGRFDVDIYDKSKVQKILTIPSMAGGQHNMAESTEDADENNEDNGDGEDMAEEEIVDNDDGENVNGGDDVMVEYQPENIDQNFQVTLTLSNVNNTSHGVLIPRNVNPNNRSWHNGEIVTLVTNNGTWSVGVVLNNGNPRFSAGWNQFSRDNKLKRNGTLLFTMAGEEDGVLFNVVVA